MVGTKKRRHSFLQISKILFNKATHDIQIVLPFFSAGENLSVYGSLLLC